MHKPIRGEIPPDCPYLPNKYTAWYYGIITKARCRKHLLEFGEKHHVILDCFFVKRRRKGPPGWLLGEPNDTRNLVMLTPREHFLCHWLLTKMVTGQAKCQTFAALAGFCKQNPHQNRRLSSGAYAKIRESLVLACIGSKIYNNGNVQRRFRTDPGDGWVQGPLESNKNRHKGSKMYNNGVIAIRSKTHPGDGWILGSLNGTVGLKWWHDKDGRTTMSKSQPGPEWQLGLPRVSKMKNGSKWWNDGKREVQAKESPGPGWKPGMLGGSKGKLWYNNGVVNKMFDEDPGQNWTPGMLPKKTS
jgi:hypothetical protein